MTTARYVNAAPTPLMLWDGRIVSGAGTFEAASESHYLRRYLSAGLVVAIEGDAAEAPADTPAFDPAFPTAPTTRRRAKEE